MKNVLGNKFLINQEDFMALTHLSAYKNLKLRNKYENYTSLYCSHLRFQDVFLALMYTKLLLDNNQFVSFLVYSSCYTYFTTQTLLKRHL